jgi:ABC-type antimicrobial peptide transport system permease subunit
MLRNYLTVAVRNLIKNKVYVMINVAGMGVALAFCLTIYLIYAYNNEFDDFYKGISNIVRVHEFKQDASGQIQRFELAPIAMGPRIPKEISGVADQTRYLNWGGNLKYEDVLFRESIAYVDSNFLDFFKIQLKTGSLSGINDKNNIFLTEELAKKYFGDEPVLGKRMSIQYGTGKSIELTVAGVFEQIPMNSSFIFDALTSIENFMYGNSIAEDDWTPWQQASIYLRLNEGIDPEQIESQMDKYVAIQNDAREEWKISEFELVDFKDASIVNQGVIDGSNANFRLRTEVLVIFSIMALLILLIACFNLANTSMSLIGSRTREIGVRKVMGGGTTQVFFQFLMEMSFTSLLAILVGMAVFTWMADWFYSIWDAPIHFTYFSKLNFFIAFVLLFLLTAITSGLYPALYSRRFNPSDIFRNQIKLKGTSITSRIMNGLQFAISITMLVAGIVFSQNSEFLKMLDMGYDSENLMVMYVDNEDEYKELEAKIRNRADVEDYTGTSSHFGWSYEDTFLVLDSGNVEVRSYRIGDEYFRLMGIEVNKGRKFYEDNATDIEESIIVNEEYVKRFELEDPIGKMVNLDEGKRYIVGVVDNFVREIWSGGKTVPEVFIPVTEEEYRIFVVKARDENKQEVFNYLSESWKEVIPDRPFNGRYQEELALGSAVMENNNMRQIFFALAILGGLLSITGIFALSSLYVAKRTKEIGIRKVLGATSQRILIQLNSGFFWTMIIASIVGGIMGYLLTDQILNIMYRYHISVGIMTLVFGSLFVLVVALITTSLTILSAANTNPAYILRDE